MKNSRTVRAKDLAEWFRTQADNGTDDAAAMMARAASALERIANARRPAIANDNSAPARRRARR